MITIIKKNIANLLTVIRIIGAILLLFTEPFLGRFFLIYTICGFTDMIDGPIARLCHSESKHGAMLDTIADLLVVISVIYKVIPKIFNLIPDQCIAIIITVIAFKFLAYIIGAIKFKTFTSTHTILNKTTGILLFFLPYMFCITDTNIYIYSVSTIALITAIEEVLIVIKSKKYNPNIKTIFQKCVDSDVT